MTEELKVIISATNKELKEACKDATNDIKELGTNASDETEKLSSKLNKIIDVAMIVGAIKVVADKVAGFVKDVVGAYGEFEQLSGGVEKLFGNSSDTIMKYAQSAYKTAGLSANEYMNTITSFSASLISSLGGDTKKASEIGNQAVIDMADNANTFGTSMESIQNAYQGFAKQNFMMLDNLKLGYGGTKTEMERLLKDAEALERANGHMVSYSIDSFADMVEAIHVVQTNMNITGTTAKEADHTIQGAINSMKSAWQNLITGMGNSNADITILMNEMGDTIKTTLTNLKPIFKNIAKAFPEAIEYAIQELPSILDDVVELFNSFTDIVFDVINGIVDAIPEILSAVPAIVENVAKNAVQLLTNIIMDLPNLITSVFQAIGDSLGSIITGIFRGFGEMFGSESLQQAYEFADSISAIRDQTEELSNTISGLNEIRINANTTVEAEAGIYENIKSKLLEYTDAQGNVKAGYEEEMEQLTLLASQYGINIEMINGQLQGRSELIDSIDATIQKIKEETYAEMERENLKSAFEAEIEAKRQLAELTKQYYEEMELATQARLEGDTIAAAQHKANAENLVPVIQEASNNYVNACKEQEIASYNLAEISKGNLDNLALSFEDTGVRQEDVIKKGTDLLNGYQKDYGTTVDKMISDARRQSEDTTGWYSNLEENITTSFEDIKEKTGLTLDEWQTLQAEKFREMTEDAGLGGNDIVEGLCVAIEKGNLDYEEAVGALARLGLTKFKDVNGIHSPSTVFQGYGSNIVEGLKNGINNGRSSAINSISDLAWSLINKAKNVLGIASPSKVFKEMGIYSDEGFAVGFEEGLPDLLRTVNTVSKEIEGAFDPELAVPALDTSAIDASFSLGTVGTFNQLSTLSVEQELVARLDETNNTLSASIYDMAKLIVEAIENKDMTLDGESIFENVVNRNNIQVRATGASPLLV